MKKHIIEKSNQLNLFFATTKDEAMTLTELRFFCIYLSKLNARNPDKRTIDIPISEFEKIFNVKINSTEFTKQLKNILRRVLYIKENGNNILINLYSKFQWSNDNPQTITAACNSDIIPFLFEIRNNYTSYRLESISKLNSVSKIRLYELMKQYERIKKIKIDIYELLGMLFCTEKLFKNFRIRVLEPAIKDINEFTDITVRYEKVLKCRKCVALNFFISSKSAERPIVEMQSEQVPKLIEKSSEKVKRKSLRDLYLQYFSDEQFELFVSTIEIALQDYPDSVIKKGITAILTDCIGKFTEQKGKKEIKSNYGYMNSIIFKVTEEYKKKHKPQSYDIDEFEKFAVNYEELQKSK